MTKIQKTIIAIIFLCYVFPQKQTWATTRFEKFWFSKIHNMKFRSPFTFMPFNIKIGYFKYGGDSYWDQWEKVIANEESYNSNPIIFENISYFDDISKPKNRTMFITEIDLLKYNFFQNKLNSVDIQFGVGYKFMKSLNGVSHADKFFKPEINEYNINTTFSFQLKEKRYYTFYCAIGYADADLYESNAGKSSGNGINQSYGIGMHFLKSREFKNSLSHHGLEIRFDKVNINKISDPLDIIKSFKAKQIGLMYSFGIGYGGKKTLGDYAYQDLLNNDYIASVEKFQNFQNINSVKNKSDEINKMIEFGIKQIPYQMYEKALDDYNEGFLVQALWWLNRAMPEADEYLKTKIKQKKILIISDLLKGSINDKTINNQIDIINNLKIYDENNIELNYKLSSLLIKKANYYLTKNNFLDSYILYKEAINLNPNNVAVVKLKFKDYTVKILNYAYNYLQNNDNVVAYEMLSLIREFSNESDISEALFNIANHNLEDEKLVHIRQRIQSILYDTKENIDLGLSSIHLGQNYFRIVEILGQPLEKLTRRKFDNVYDFATFKIADKNYKLFFKNKVLIDLERP